MSRYVSDESREAVEDAQPGALLGGSEELALFISMAAVIIVLIVAIIIIVTVVRRIKNQVKRWDDSEKSLPRVSIRGMSELGHDGSINPAYQANGEDAAASNNETNA